MRKDLSNIDALLFDLDGTLWSPLLLSLQCWKEACTVHAVSSLHVTEDNLKLCFGQSASFIMSKLLGPFPKSVQLQVCETAFALENKRITEKLGSLYPKVGETLKLLADHFPLFIVSNCQSGYIEAFLETYHFSQFFVDYRSSEETGLTKAQNIAHLVGVYDLENPLYIGDTQSDALAANQSGVPFLHASYGFGKVEGTCRILDSFSDLPQLLTLRENFHGKKFMHRT